MRISTELRTELHVVASQIEPVRGSGYSQRVLEAIKRLYEERCHEARVALVSGDTMCAQRLLEEAEQLSVLQAMLFEL